ncbi:MAG: HAD family hydrolase [Planctomycetota bacterium]|nr:HAD family hydrolase [Planctomycetota bacterium]
MRLRGVLFDLDDTLIPEEGAVREGFEAACTLAQLRCGVDPAHLQEAVRSRARSLWRGAPTFPYCRSIGIAGFEGLWGSFEGDDPQLVALAGWVDDYRNVAWTGGLSELGIEAPELASELSDAFCTAVRSAFRPFVGAEELLRELRKHLRIGLLTNGASSVQRHKIRQSGLDGLFHAVVVSGEVGVGKPDPEVFRVALEALGTPAAETVMVGNSLRHDIAGARAAGMPCVWLDHTGRGHGEELEPDVRIEDITELRDVMG